MDRDEGPCMGAIVQRSRDQDDALCIELTFYSLGAFWLGGILAWGDFGLGGY